MKKISLKALCTIMIVTIAVTSQANYRLYAHGQAGIFFSPLQSYTFDMTNGFRRYEFFAHNVAAPNESYAFTDSTFSYQRGRAYATGNLANAYQETYTEDTLRISIPGGGTGQMTFVLAVTGNITRTGTGIAEALATLSINGGNQITYRDFYQGSTHDTISAQPYTITVQDGQVLGIRQRLVLRAVPSGSEYIDVDYRQNGRASITLQGVGATYSADSGSTYGTPLSASVETVQVHAGSEFSGNLESLMNSDDDQYCLLSDTDTLQASAEFQGHLNAPGLLTVSASVESMATRLGLSQVISLYNHQIATFEVCGGGIASGTETITQVSGDASKYVNLDSQGLVRCLVSWSPINDEEPAQDGWLLCIDQLTFEGQ